MPTVDPEDEDPFDNEASHAYFAYRQAEGEARRKVQGAYSVEQEYGCCGIVDALLQKFDRDQQVVLGLATTSGAAQ